MAVIKEIIRLENDNTISFGDYITLEKKKAENFEALGDMYKVKTHNELTRLEKNGKLLLETVPGTTIHNFKLNSKKITFSMEGFEDSQVTMELEADTEYKILINDLNVGSMKSNFSGKVNFSLDLNSAPQSVSVEKI